MENYLFIRNNSEKNIVPFIFMSDDFNPAKIKYKKIFKSHT